MAEYICILYSRLADYLIYMIRELKGLTADNHYSSDKCNLVLFLPLVSLSLRVYDEL